jgi:hypothetical protein
MTIHLHIFFYINFMTIKLIIIDKLIHFLFIPIYIIFFYEFHDDQI